MKTVTGTTPAPEPVEDRRVMTLLHDHVPLALLCDLAGTELSSAEILQVEGGPDDHWWER